MSRSGDSWLDVRMVKPPCPRGPDALGTPVLVWPRGDTDGFAYYGRRVSTQPNFYMYGLVIHGVTHWQPMPKRPRR